MQATLHNLLAAFTPAKPAAATGYLPLSLNNTSSTTTSTHSIIREKQQQDVYPPFSSSSSSCSSSGSSASSQTSSDSSAWHPFTALFTPSSTATTTTTTSRRSLQSSSHSYCRPLQALFVAAIFALALVGLLSIVAFLVGLIQRTPIYTQKALQDSGWTRRPIQIQLGSSSSTAGSSAGSSSSDSDSPSSIYQGITVHDFTPVYRDLLRDVQHSGTASTGTSPYSTFDSEDSLKGDNGNSYSPSSSPSSHASSGRTPSGLASQQHPVPSNELHLLILCPLRNSADDLPHLFEKLDNLHHPFANTSLGFLVGDEDDNTGNVLLDLVQERMHDQDRKYRHVTLLHKDFNVDMPSGGARHSYLMQTQRRTVMARARTYLLTSTLEPSVDWVLWLDSDIAEFSPSIFEDLLVYGNGGVAALSDSSQGLLSEHIAYQQSQTQDLVDRDHALDLPKASSAGRRTSSQRTEWNDVIIPNAMTRRPDTTLLGFDMNNWAETPDSLSRKASLRPDELLVEGNIWQHMHRQHLADLYTTYINSSSSHTQRAEGPQVFSLSQLDSLSRSDPRLDTSSDAYIGRLVSLDGIGGVAALVRAEVHRMGAIFPSWIFENQLETEAFGVLAKKMGARVVGLPNLFVLHST